MTKTLQLEEQTAKRLYKTATPEFKQMLEESFGKKFFLEDICDRIQTLEDVLRIAGKTYEEVVPWHNPMTKAHLSQNAYALLQCITEAYNEGVVFDWGSMNQPKYHVWWEKGAWGWVVVGYPYYYGFSRLGFGLYFVSSKVAEDAVKKFKSIFIDYLP